MHSIPESTSDLAPHDTLNRCEVGTAVQIPRRTYRWVDPGIFIGSCAEDNETQQDRLNCGRCFLIETETSILKLDLAGLASSGNVHNTTLIMQPAATRDGMRLEHLFKIKSLSHTRRDSNRSDQNEEPTRALPPGAKLPELPELRGYRDGTVSEKTMIDNAVPYRQTTIN